MVVFQFTKSHLQSITQNHKDHLQAQNYGKQLPTLSAQCNFINCFVRNCFNHVITLYMNVDTKY